MDDDVSQISLVCRHQVAARKPTFGSNSSPPSFLSLDFYTRLQTQRDLQFSASLLHTVDAPHIINLNMQNWVKLERQLS